MRSRQDGNVLFYILIAVVLLAALSYTVARNGRGGVSSVGQEKASLYATELLEYSNAIAQAAAQIRLRGYQETALSFENAFVAGYGNANCSEDDCKIFSPDGGGIQWQDLPVDMRAASSANWRYSADMGIKDVGQSCTSASCSDLLALAWNIDEQVCRAVNKILKIPNFEIIPVHSDAGGAMFTGAYSYVSNIGGEAGSAVLAGARSGCFFSTDDGYYIFYATLIAR